MAAEQAPVRSRKKRPDIATLGGLLIAVAGLVGGLLLEGGRVEDVSQVTAAFIVLGGTLGAVMVSTPRAILWRAVRKLRWIFIEESQSHVERVELLVVYARKARRNGIVSLEQDALELADEPFLRKTLLAATDGMNTKELRHLMELELEIAEQHGEAEAKVWERAGGYAPTIGIIGAVMGLIQVMKNLSNLDAVGHGIAVAFVATIYGVGAANLFFLPAASKIRARLHDQIRRNEMELEGVLSIMEGLNPNMIRDKLLAFEAGASPAAAKQPVAAAGAPLRAGGDRG
jgi:chemotaxis protein MotA